MSPAHPFTLSPLHSLPRDRWLAELHALAVTDLPAARRVALLDILWHEPFITRTGLMWRLRYLLRLDCWGDAPAAAFRQDRSVVCAWLSEHGHHLCYSRRRERPGYYIEGREQFDERLKTMIEFSMREVDVEQINIYRKLEPGQRIWQAARLSDWLQQANQFRIQERHKRYESNVSQHPD